jgi:D-alanyl-D-alanine carboxypeptidase
VENRIEAFRQANGVPGVTAGFVLPDGQRAAASAGVSCRSDGRPMEPDELMLSGSIGKTYVSAVLLQLVDGGRVELDRKIVHWFGSDEWFTRLPNAQDISLRMLMNHTSGIPRHIFTPDFQAAVAKQPQKVWKPEELVSYVLDAEPLFPAGEGWSYADTNYILVGMIIERVTGRTYYEELSRRILVPLGLRDTTPSDRPDLPRLACGYTSETNPFSLPVEAAQRGHYAMNPQVEWTGGGLVNTPLDLARWAWLLYGGRVVQAATLRQLLDGVPMAPGSDQQYGLGVMMRPSRHGLVLGHSGWMPGYVSTMAYYPDWGLAVAVQMNTDVGVTRSLLEDLVDQLAADLMPEAPVHGP